MYRLFPVFPYWLSSCLLLCGLATTGYPQEQSSAVAPQEFLTRLLAAPSQEARQTLLTTHATQLNQELAQSLLTAAGKAPDRRKATEIYALAADIAERVQAPEKAAQALNSQGVAYITLGNYAQALEPLSKSLQIRRRLKKDLDVAKTLNNIAAAYQYQGLYIPCLQANEESLHIKQQLLAQTPQDEDLKKGVAASLVNLGGLYEFLGNTPRAVHYYQQGLPLYQALADQTALASTLNNLGFSFLNQELPARAMELFQRALEHNRSAPKADAEQKAQILNNIGLAYLKQGNHALALTACQESLELRLPLNNQEKIARTKKHLARIHLAQNNAVEALRFANEAAQLAAAKAPEDYWSARTIAGQAHLRQNHTAEAEQCFTDAIRVIEQLRTQAAISPEIKQRFFENKVTPYLAMVEICVAQSRPNEALTYAERTKARVLLDLIANRSEAGVPPLSLTSAQPLTLAEVGALLPNEKTALLEFILADEKVYLFALHRKTRNAAPELSVLPLARSKTEVRALVTRLRRELAERKVGFATTAAELYRDLLKPAQQLLSGKQSLVIVPDGVLWELPFQTLMSAPGRYLLEDYNINYVPSLTALRELIQRQSAAPNTPATLLALGNPTLSPTTQLPPLPETEKQVRELGAMFGTPASKIYLGAEASEQRFKAEASQYAMINLATHGIFDDQQPMSSRVLLAQGGGEDGALEAHEILRLKLNAKLVVLSACETARGYAGPGEGVIGLTWAFLNAGAPTVVVSQWQVREDSTAELMRNFYRQIKMPGAPPATALRQAALTVMKDARYRHPFYWAGFVLVGSGG